MRRQLWLQHSQAVQVINLYAEAQSGGKKGKRESQHQEAPRPKQRIETVEQFISGLDKD